MSVKLRDRDPIYQCWRVAAIYRCVLRYGKDRDWALRHLRELDPTGRKDNMVDIWFMGISLSGRPLSHSDEAAEALPLAA